MYIADYAQSVDNLLEEGCGKALIIPTSPYFHNNNIIMHGP